jgi:23S rRNA (guanosine2251-2'-O)-methyltransferase
MTTAYVYGIHAVSRRLRQAPQHCLALICADTRNPRLLQLIEQAREAGIEVQSQGRAQLTRLCGTDKHQGCLLQTDSIDPAMDFDECLASIDERSLLLVLDGVQDPHNLGACLRTADACGVDAVIIPRDRSVKLNATVRKVAAGGAESVPLIQVTNLARSLKQLKQAGVWISEGAGLRRLTADACDYLVKLPMRGQVESLNVSVATGVCLYEILRSRGSAS